MRKRNLWLVLFFIIFISVFPVFSKGTEAQKPSNGKSVEENLKAFKRVNAIKALMNQTGHIEYNMSERFGTPVYMEGDLYRASCLLNIKNLNDASLSFLSNHRTIFGIKDPPSELRLISENKDELGYTHLKYQQILANIDLTGMQIIFHFDDKDRLYFISGEYATTPSVSTEFKVSSVEAVDIAFDHFRQVKQDEPYMHFISPAITPLGNTFHLHGRLPFRVKVLINVLTYSFREKTALLSEQWN
jgi:hypothetical protein